MTKTQSTAEADGNVLMTLDENQRIKVIIFIQLNIKVHQLIDEDNCDH